MSCFNGALLEELKITVESVGKKNDRVKKWIKLRCVLLCSQNKMGEIFQEC